MVTIVTNYFNNMVTIVTNYFNNMVTIVTNYFNHLLPIAHKSARIGETSILKLEGIIKKISYERRDYESVDEKSIS